MCWTFVGSCSGQLGHGLFHDYLDTPQRVLAFVDNAVLSVSCGSEHTVAVVSRQDKSVLAQPAHMIAADAFCWGRYERESFQLGS